uniref:NHS-like protein 1 n=1 Tax=Eptatretus burgeri TaxID=7764 RepID=A0A8C4R676_EPTBU
MGPVVVLQGPLDTVIYFPGTIFVGASRSNAGLAASQSHRGTVVQAKLHPPPLPTCSPKDAPRLEQKKKSNRYHAPWPHHKQMFLPVSRPASMQALEDEAQSNMNTLLRDCDRVHKDSWCSSWCYSQSPLFNRLSSRSLCETQATTLKCCIYSQTSLSSDLEEVEWPRSPAPLSSSLRVAPGSPRTLDKQTNWSGCLPLPTPEQRMREHAESITTDIISIDVSGSNFERQASMRRSLLYTEGTLNRRIKNSRRKTISGVTDKMHHELGTCRSFFISTSLEQKKDLVIPQAAPVKNFPDLGRTVAPSVRRIRAQRGHGIAAQVLRSSTSNEVPVTGPMGMCVTPNKAQPIAQGNILAMAMAGFSRSQTSCDSSRIKFRKGRSASSGATRPRSEEIPVAVVPRTFPEQSSLEPRPLHPALSLPQALHCRPENSWKLPRAETETTADTLESVLSDGSDWEMIELVKSQTNYNGDAEGTWWCWEDSVGEGSSIPDSGSLHSVDMARLSESGQIQTTLGNCGWSNGGGSDVASTCSTLSRSFCLRKTREKPQPPRRTDSLERPESSRCRQIGNSNHNARILNEDSQDHCRPCSDLDINVTLNGWNSTPSTPPSPRVMPFSSQTSKPSSQKPKEIRAMSRTFHFTKHSKPCVPERQSSLVLSETFDSRQLPPPPSELLTPTSCSFSSCNVLESPRPLPPPSAILAPQGTLANLRSTDLNFNSVSTPCPPTPPPKAKSPVWVANAPISTDCSSKCIAGLHKPLGPATFGNIHPQSQFCEDSSSSTTTSNTLLANKELVLDKRASLELPVVKVADLFPPCSTDCLEYSSSPLPPPSPYGNPPLTPLPSLPSPVTMPQQLASTPPLCLSTSPTLPTFLNPTSMSSVTVLEDVANELVLEHQNPNPEEHIENSQQRIVKLETEKQLNQSHLQCTMVPTKPSRLLCPRTCSLNSVPTYSMAVVNGGTSPPTSRQLSGPRRRQNPGNEEFKALLLRKGSRMDTAQRMSAVDILRIGQGDTSPSSTPIGSPERSPSKRYVSEGIAPTSGALTVGGVRLGRSKTPPSAGSSRFNSRSRLHSLPMQAISEGEVCLATYGNRPSSSNQNPIPIKWKQNSWVVLKPKQIRGEHLYTML